MEQAIQPLNVAAATMLVQILLMSILAIASSVVNSSSAHQTSRFLINKGFITWPLKTAPILIIALMSLFILLLSESMYGIWGPIFNGVGINTIETSVSISMVFILNIILVSYLIGATGGSEFSPFTSVLFTLPALAIFLRLPSYMFISCAVFSALIYLWFLFVVVNEQRIKGKTAAAVINICCLFLSIFTGYITRPVPINELAVPHIHEHISEAKDVNSSENKK